MCGLWRPFGTSGKTDNAKFKKVFLGHRFCDKTAKIELFLRWGGVVWCVLFFLINSQFCKFVIQRSARKIGMFNVNVVHLTNMKYVQACNMSPHWLYKSVSTNQSKLKQCTETLLLGQFLMTFFLQNGVEKMFYWFHSLTYKVKAWIDASSNITMFLSESLPLSFSSLRSFSAICQCRTTALKSQMLWWPMKNYVNQVNVCLGCSIV